MKQGLLPIRKDHRDYSFYRSYGTIAPPSFPPDFSVDAGLGIPNQDQIDTRFTPPVPALPYGCTDETATDLCVEEDAVLYNPMLIENITHANANGGGDIRISLNAATQAFGRTAYFNIQSSSLIDMFDSIRLAMYSSLPEKRAVSVGTPWYSDWTGNTPILPIPATPISQATWHNHAIVGWKTIQGVPYLVSKPWQGTDYGDKGYVYWSRELTNVVFAISGTGAFTLSKVTPQQILPVDLGVVATIVSFIRNLLHI